MKGITKKNIISSDNFSQQYTKYIDAIIDFLIEAEEKYMSQCERFVVGIKHIWQGWTSGHRWYPDGSGTL